MVELVFDYFPSLFSVVAGNSTCRYDLWWLHSKVEFKTSTESLVVFCKWSESTSGIFFCKAEIWQNMVGALENLKYYNCIISIDAKSNNLQLAQYLLIVVEIILQRMTEIESRFY